MESHLESDYAKHPEPASPAVNTASGKPAPCRLCPRRCGAVRGHGAARCHSGSLPHVAWAGLHRWEEPGISGPQSAAWQPPESQPPGLVQPASRPAPQPASRLSESPLTAPQPPARAEAPASGAVFFSGCSLGCVFCQNHAVSRSGGAGRPMDAPALAALFLSLQRRGAYNLNLVTATHWRPWALNALALARAEGLSLPLVWNTGGYESCEAVAELAPHVAVWLFDVKYHSPALAGLLAGAPNYWPTALAALRAAHAAAGPAVQRADGLLQKGVVLRVLVLPGHHRDAMAILRGVAEALPPEEVFLSLMRQYTPNGDARLPKELRRTLSSWEYRQVAGEADRLGFTRGWLQGRHSVGECFVPHFEVQSKP